jgi:hypothetical protein
MVPAAPSVHVNLHIYIRMYSYVHISLPECMLSRSLHCCPQTPRSQIGSKPATHAAWTSLIPPHRMFWQVLLCHGTITHMGVWPHLVGGINGCACCQHLRHRLLVSRGSCGVQRPGTQLQSPQGREVRVRFTSKVGTFPLFDHPNICTPTPSQFPMRSILSVKHSPPSVVPFPSRSCNFPSQSCTPAVSRAICPVSHALPSVKSSNPAVSHALTPVSHAGMHTCLQVHAKMFTVPVLRATPFSAIHRHHEQQAPS